MSVVYRVAQSSHFTGAAPMLLAFLSLELLDRYNLVGPVPLMLASGFYMTGIYQRARGLEAPLWYSRQLSRFSTLSVATLLLGGYAMLNRNI